MMIQTKPIHQQESKCPHCATLLKPLRILWQGIHVCVESECAGCCAEIVEDLKISHAIHSPYQVDLEKGMIFGNKLTEDWLGRPLIESLRNPQRDEICITKEVFKPYKRVVILNCIDFLYGHCLLKLLNAQRHLEHHLDYGLVVIVPKFIRWMVPEGTAEIWTVDIPLENSQLYYLGFDKFVTEESSRFDQIYVSEAYSHPGKFDITEFTGVPKHSFCLEKFNILFVWREDRIWCNLLLFRILRKLKLLSFALYLQNLKVRKLFKIMKSRVPSTKFAIAGLGTNTKFPDWIEDLRINKFDEQTERKACQIYSESRLVIGVHGSNMLLPSGHAGMTIDLMPTERWGNFAQDILYHESDARLASFRYRYVPLETSIAVVAQIASNMVIGYSDFKQSMTADKPS